MQMRPNYTNSLATAVIVTRENNAENKRLDISLWESLACCVVNFFIFYTRDSFSEFLDDIRQ